jgi:formate hydrogenlyase transcriptional activator
MLLVKLTSNNQTLGFLNILSTDTDAFQQINHSILKGITEQLSAAISNVISREEILRRDQENEALLAVSTAISSNCKVEEIMEVISSKLGAVVYFNDICVSQYNLQKGSYKVLPTPVTWFATSRIFILFPPPNFQSRMGSIML